MKQKKECVIAVKVTYEEREKIQEEAKKRGVGMSTYLRLLALNRKEEIK